MRKAWGYNDIELMICSTYTFAVRNAVYKLKDAANFITRSNEEDASINTHYWYIYPYWEDHNECFQMNNEHFKEGLGGHHVIHYKKLWLLFFISKYGANICFERKGVPYSYNPL